MRVGEMRLSFERGRIKGGSAIERRAGSSCLPLSQLEYYTFSSLSKCNTIKWIVFEVKSASVITGKGCWQCGSIKSGTMDWGKDHDRTQNIASQLSFMGPCNPIIQQLWWVASHLRIGQLTFSEIWRSCLLLNDFFVSMYNAGCLQSWWRRAAGEGAEIGGWRRKWPAGRSKESSVQWGGEQQRVIYETAHTSACERFLRLVNSW